MQRMAASAQLNPGEKLPELNQPQNFSDLMKMAVNSVNEAQQTAGDLKKRFELGDPNVDLPQVMVAAQKSSLAFSAMLKIRNDLVQAYKDVMSMPV